MRPDLLLKDLRDALYYQRLDELRQAVRDGKPPVYEESFMTAWCHGAPGIGLARLRAFELTGQALYRQEAEAALRSTLPAIEDALSQGGKLLPLPRHRRQLRAALLLEAASEPASLDEIVVRVAEAAGLNRPGEQLADFVGVSDCPVNSRPGSPRPGVFPGETARAHDS